MSLSPITQYPIAQQDGSILSLFFIVALLCSTGSAWWGWLRYGPLGVLPAGIALLGLVILQYIGHLPNL